MTNDQVPTKITSSVICSITQPSCAVSEGSNSLSFLSVCCSSLAFLIIIICHRCRIKLHVCVRHNGELSKMTEPIKMPYRWQTGAGSRNHVLDGSAHLHHLVSTTERSMHSGNATSCQITLITWYITIIILRPLYRSTCVSWHLQLRTGGFAGAKFYCSHAPADDQSAFAQQDFGAQNANGRQISGLFKAE